MKRAPNACRAPFAAALLVVLHACLPEPTDDGGASDAGRRDAGSDVDAGARADGGASDDPCGIAGTWTNGCGAVELCGPCAGSSLPLGAEFTLSPTIAREGGEITVGAATLILDVATCTLRSANRFCSPWTDDAYTLRDGVGSGTAYGHCDTGGPTCDCEVALACTPRRLR